MSSWRFCLILICACLSCNLLQHWLSVRLQVYGFRTNLLWLFGEWESNKNKHTTQFVLRDVWLRWQSSYNYLFLSFLRSTPNDPLTRKLLQRVRIRPVYEWGLSHALGTDLWTYSTTHSSQKLPTLSSSTRPVFHYFYWLRVLPCSSLTVLAVHNIRMTRKINMLIFIVFTDLSWWEEMQLQNKVMIIILQTVIPTFVDN